MQVGSRRDKTGGSGPSRTRVPKASEPDPRARRSSDKPLLRLALSRGNLAIELDAELTMGPLRVAELSVILPDVRFPVDLTGGVTKFRHRRGSLSSAIVTVKADELARHVAPSLRGLLGPGTPELVIAPSEEGALVGISSGSAALAFDVLLAPMGSDLRLLMSSPRGIGLGAPAFVLALRALAAMSKPIGEGVGTMVILRDVAGELGRRVLPEAGARAPSARGIEMTIPAPDAKSVITLVAREGASPPALDRRILRALELAELVDAFDVLAVAGDLEGARAGYLAALERAPRHPDISLRLAAIDLCVGERAEAALGTVVEALPAVEAGIIGGDLLAASDDLEGAFAAYSKAASEEPYGPLAALALLSAGRHTDDRRAKLDALDAALVRAPGHIEARWERLAARLAVGDVRGAVGDAEHIEAASSGAAKKHAAALRSGSLFAERGHAAEASTRFERALRYSPSSPEGVLGLARALREMGRPARALDLFARAAALAERRGQASPACDLELGRALAEHARDLPAAIARAQRVPQQAPETYEARLLEGRWRVELGDLTGAARALSRLREAAELFPGQSDDRGRVARWLAEAARLDELELGDSKAAHRDLALALRLAPRDRSIATELRRLARLTEGPRPDDLERAPAHVSKSGGDRPSMDEPRAEPPRFEAIVPSVATESAPDDVPDESLVEDLTAKLRANPSDHGVALELARVLALLGRDLELLALVSARIDEGPPEARADLVPLRREVLGRLASAARVDGRGSEAELYEMMRDAE